MRRSVLTAGGAALAIALAGCGDGASSGDGDSSGNSQSVFGNTKQLAKQASESTEDVKTAKVSVQAKGGALPVEGNGEARFAGDDTAMSMNMSIQGQDMKMRIVDENYYFQFPKQARKQMGIDKPWAKLALDDDNPMSKMLSQMMDQNINSSDPTKMMDTLKDGGKITKKESTENGSHYWIDVDPIKMIEQTYPDMADKMPKKAKKKLGDGTIPMQLWLNDDSLPTKITMDMKKLNSMGQGQGGQGQQAAPGKLVVKYDDWGEPVDIQKPSKDQVGEFKMPDMPSTEDMPN